MTWTYDTALTASKDKVRIAIGDTDGTDQQFSDEEVNYFISAYGSVVAASIAAVRGLIAKYSRKVEKEVGSMRLNYRDRIQNYRDLLDQLQLQVLTGVGAAKPYAGGISIADKDTQEDDDDRVKPAFKAGMMENV